GFPSSHAGHLALIGLREQDYPGARKIEDWPSWGLPILRWAKRQGAVVGFAHSGWGLEVKSSELPNYELPPFDGIGANEYVVDVTHDAVDFISAGDTPAVWELNIWYHTLNSGFRTKISGETDFPCIYGERVGLGRSYVKLDGALDYDAWCEGIARGRAYVSDGRSHLMDLKVGGRELGVEGSELRLDAPGKVTVAARAAALLAEKPDPALKPYSELIAGADGRGSKWAADLKPFWHVERARIPGTRDVKVEVVVNGHPVAEKVVAADGATRDVSFEVPIERSSWVALRILGTSHTNPVFVVVGGQPIRASRRSVEWCLKSVDQCWSQKKPFIAPAEMQDAIEAYEHARVVYRRRLSECAAE
ncbi:MAG TPA: CehA/McbA family metallohydrolase, partial [Planctomycetota bacterium]|nr:CehA/McbA family metallohydrolase [Planctomycetota bacterium]